MMGELRREKIILLMLILSLSVGHVLALEFSLPNEFSDKYKYDMDIPWRAGTNVGYSSGYWGFSYNWNPTTDLSDLQPYYNIETYYNRWNKTIQGPLVEGGQVVRTTFGANLNVNYSPYIAHFDEDVLGMRIAGYKWSLGKNVSVALDGTYVFGFLNRSTTIWEGPRLVGANGDYVININGDIAEGKIKNTILSYYNKTKNNYFSNYALEWDLPLFSKRLNLSGVYAGYQEEQDWLYELSGNLELIPRFLFWETTLQDNSNINLTAIRGTQNKYIVEPIDPREYDLLEQLNFWGKYYNFGPTILLKLGPTDNMIKLDYASTAKKDFFSNAPVHVPENPRVALGAMTKYRNFNFQNSFYRQITDKNRGRSFYRLSAIASPEYPLPGDVKASFRLDLDMDFNYTSLNKNKVFSLAGLRLYKTADIWRFKKVELDSFFIMSLAGDDYRNVAPFKYSLMARYNAPNGLRFRLQYFSSDDFATQPLDIFGKDRYEPYRWYYNDLGKTGLRMIIALPF